MRLCANTFNFKGMQGTAGPVCQPAALSLCAGRGDPGDGGIGEYSTGNTPLNLYSSPSKARKMHNSRPFRDTLANALLADCGTFKVCAHTRCTRCDSELAT